MAEKSDGVKAPQTTAAAKPDEAAVAAFLAIPDDDVLIRRIRGIDGVHAIGSVKLGRLYTVSLVEATTYCLGDQPEFEPVFKADRTRIEGEASRAAERKAKRAALESELSKLQ